jgi:GNAT superfamily N-acetyltransferase
MSSFPRVRPAVAADTADIWRFVRMLADYERLEQAMTATPADLAQALFGPAPRVFAEIAELDGAAVGFSLCFYTYSTFAGRAGLYVEDLFVLPEARGRGVGRALLASLARRCLTEGVAHLDWAVLDWNTSAIAFYEGLGAQARDAWRLRRVSGPALTRLARPDAAGP